MIKRLRIHNFRTFLNFEMDLTRRHLLIGKNNSGKSNLCLALRFLSNTCFSDYQFLLDALPGGSASFRHWYYRRPETEFRIECELRFGDKDLQYVYELQLQTEDVPRVVPSAPSAHTTREILTVEGGGWPRTPLIESDGQQVKLLHEGRYEKGELQSSDSTFVITRAPIGCSMLSKLYQLDTNRRAIHFRQFLGKLGYYAFSAPLMRLGLPSPPDQTSGGTEFLSTHGDNLPTALYHMKNQFEPNYRQIVELACLLEPDLDSINFLPNPGGGRPTPYVITKRGRQVGWATLSDGTLLVLALAYVFQLAEIFERLPDSPPMIAILEEPENGLFTGLLRDLWDRLQAIAPRSQFITTTHNPYFIDLFDRDLESVVLLKREEDITTAHTLAEYAPSIERAFEHSSLGEQHFRESFQ